jgi:hypothetical protein
MTIISNRKNKLRIISIYGMDFEIVILIKTILPETKSEVSTPAG